MAKDTVINLLKDIVEHYDTEDRFVRDRQLIDCKKYKLLWDGFTHIWWDEVAHDWRVYDELRQAESEEYYDKSINIFKAYLESIIAALSVTIPPIKCFPDDAENPLDLETAKACDKIAELIYKHNDVALVWLRAMYVYCTEGLVFGYNYSKNDKAYGVHKEKKYEDVEEVHSYTSCPNCGHQLEDLVLPDDSEVSDETKVEEDKDICPECRQIVNPERRTEKLTVTKLVGTTDNPKSRQCIEVYGLTNVKVPIYARRAEECSYLKYSYELDFAIARERFGINDTLRKKIIEGGGYQSGYDYYDVQARVPNQYLTDTPKTTVTINEWWFRPCAYHVKEEIKDVKELSKKFPEGCKVTFVDDIFIKAESSKLDDHWTMTRNPFSESLHHDPLGATMVSVQDVTITLISLILQTIEHGIPQTFADPNVLNFKMYSKSKVSPGSIYPATPKAGKDMGTSFYEVRTATLPQEVIPFAQWVQSLGQVVSGALPSLFGGALEGTKTASEYGMSRAQALQRLQNTWKIFTIWWKEIFAKAIVSYIENMQEDEKYVTKNAHGGYINNFIRMAELEGNIGNIEVEASENLPMTWMHKKESIMQLMQLNNPVLMQFLTNPQNLPKIKEAIGLTDIYMEGEEDREAEYAEIGQLLASEPIIGEDGMEIPSVDVDPIFDNHQLRFDIIRTYIISEAGRLAKLENEAGYRNLLLHAKAHHMQLMERAKADAEAQTAQLEANNGPKPEESPAPIQS